MSFFIIQNDEINTLKIEKTLLIEQLKKSYNIHSYIESSLKDNYNIQNFKTNNIIIPIGTIEFVTKILNQLYGFEKENPIEIPKYLRTDEFLKREYKLIRGFDLPKTGHYFIKNASKLKDFSYCGELEYLINENIFKHKNNKFNTILYNDDIYVISSDFKPISEYRVYVFNKEIENIVHYDGSPLLFPDIKLIQKAINLINYNEKWLKSYTIDIMVNNVGTAIIEIHNFTSCGIYTTLVGNNLPYAYIDGIEYLLNDNKKIEI